jgi:hypothetical protein
VGGVATISFYFAVSFFKDIFSILLLSSTHKKINKNLHHYQPPSYYYCNVIIAHTAFAKISELYRAKMIYNSILVLGLSLTGVLGERVSYKGSRVMRCQPTTQAHLDEFKALELQNSLELDFWVESRTLASPIDVMVPAKYLPDFGNYVLAQIPF